MKSRFLKLHDNGRLVIINVDEIRAVEPYEEPEEVDEDYDEDYDEDEDEEFDDDEDEESDREEEVEDFEKESNEGGSKSVISYKGLKNEYTWVDETPEEIWDMLE
ncbi:hypothetical protein IJJ97_07045 [bacterium]|nr:hypothetical protein [bacterium]